MRSFFIFLFAAPVALAACGGSTEALPSSAPDSGATGDAGQDAPPPPDGGGSMPDTGTGVDSGPDCNELLAQLSGLEAKAQACCPTCDIVQCYSSVPGPCCDISVTLPSSPATQAFEAALTQYTKECFFGCPAIACPKTPSGVCGPSGVCE